MTILKHSKERKTTTATTTGSQYRASIRSRGKKRRCAVQYICRLHGTERMDVVRKEFQ